MKSLRISLLILASGISNLIAQTNGIDQTLNFVAPPTGGKFVSWHAKIGRSYFLQVSDPTAHLHKWNWSTVIERGQNQTISYEVDSTADKGFFRLHYTDQTATNLETADFDNDGLTNLQEITPYILPGTNAPRSIGGAPAPNSTQTNPLNGDTDGDGLSDKFERDNNLDGTDNGSRNPNNGPNGDPDGDGISNIDQQTAENTPKPNLSTELVYRGILYAEQQFDFGAYAQTTLYSKSLVDFHTTAMQNNSVMKAPDIRVAATINVDSAYIQPTHPDDPQQAYSTPGDFKSYFKTNFPIPPLSTTDDLSTWSIANTALNFGLTYRDILPNFLFIDANEATYEFAVRAAESSTTERQEKRTLLQVLKTTNTSNPSNFVVTYSTITPATRELTFTIPAGKKTSGSQRISTPVAQIVGAEDRVKELTLLPIEIVNKDKKTISKLKVGKMSEAGVLSGNGATPILIIETDPDHFYVRVRGAGAMGAISIKVSTADNPEPTYNDDSTQIDLVADGADAISKSMLLVSDDVDDDHTVDGITDDASNDRTHKIQLGGSFKIDAIKIGTGAWQTLDIKAPAPALKKVKVKFINCQAGIPLFKGPCWSQGSIDVAKKLTKERYAQAGVDLEFSTIPGPDIGYTGWLAHGEFPTEVTNGILEIPQVTRSIIDAGPITEPEAIMIYLVTRLDDVGWISYNGVAIPQKYLNVTNRNKNYGNKIFVGNPADNYSTDFTSSHELMHILLNAIHGDYSVEYADYRMLWHETVPNINIGGTKRMSETQTKKIEISPFAK